MNYDLFAGYLELNQYTTSRNALDLVEYSMKLSGHALIVLSLVFGSHALALRDARALSTGEVQRSEDRQSEKSGGNAPSKPNVSLPNSDSRNSTKGPGDLFVTGDGQQPYGLAERASDLVEAIAYVPPALRDGIRDGTGNADLTEYVRNALKTGKRVHFAAGRWKLCDTVTINNKQTVHGDGPLLTVLDVGPCFNLKATSVVDVSAGDSSGISEIGWDFDQSTAAAVAVPAYGTPGYDAAVALARSKLIQYPWALDIRRATRAKIGRLRMSKAFNGINCQGNCGGLDAGLLELGTFNAGIIEDGVYDFIHHAAIHCWQFGMNETLAKVYYDSKSYCAIFGKVDGLDVASISTFRQAILFNQNGESGIARQISSVALDANGARIVHISGDTQFGMISSTKDATEGAPTIQQTGGSIYSSNLRLFGAHGNTQIAVTGGFFFASGGWVQQVANKQALVVTGGIAKVSGIYFQTDPAQARTTPLIYQSGGGLYFMNNVIQQKAAGSGAAVHVEADNPQVVVANNSLGNYRLVAKGTAGTYAPNFKTGR